MLRALTSPYRDWGLLALGFSGGALIEAVLSLAMGHGPETPAVQHLVCGALVGPLVVWSLLLRRTLPHRVVLAMAVAAYAGYCVLGAR